MFAFIGNKYSLAKSDPQQTESLIKVTNLLVLSLNNTEFVQYQPNYALCAYFLSSRVVELGVFNGVSSTLFIIPPSLRGPRLQIIVSVWGDGLQGSAPFPAFGLQFIMAGDSIGD